MFKSLSRPVALMFLLMLALPATGVAQTKDTADVHGVVLDASGRPAAGYPLRIMTSQWGEVIMHATEDDGSFAVGGLPPGDYELRVFEPGGSPDHPIASKKLTLAAGQAEKIEIRVGGGRTTGTTLGTTAVSSTAVAIFALVIAAGLAAFFALRAREKARS
jgi:hypothetical protein